MSRTPPLSRNVTFSHLSFGRVPHDIVLTCIAYTLTRLLFSHHCLTECNTTSRKKILHETKLNVNIKITHLYFLVYYVVINYFRCFNDKFFSLIAIIRTFCQNCNYITLTVRSINNTSIAEHCSNIPCFMNKLSI